MSLGVGSTLKNIQKKDLNKLNVNYPNLKEQTKIANFFTLIDKKLKLQNQKLKLLKDYKKGLLLRMFNVDDKLRFKEFDDEWNINQIKQIFTVTRGNVLNKQMISSKINNQSSYPVYSSKTENNGLLGFYKDYLFENCITWTTDGAKAGTVNFRNGKFYCTNVCGVLKSLKFSNLTLAMIISRKCKKYVSSQLGNPKLMNNTMGNIEIQYPNLKEQTKIADFFTLIDKKINNNIKIVNYYFDTRKKLLHDMFI